MSYLDYVVYEGMKKRYGEITSELKQRADYELGVINKMGLPEEEYADKVQETADFKSHADENDSGIY